MSDEVMRPEDEVEAAQPEVQEAPVTPVVPVGTQLRLAREVRGISVGDVSSVLKFSVRQIEALERDDFTELKGNTFLRGFVRSYARFLKIDEAPLLALLQDEVVAPATEVREIDNMNAAMPARSSSVALHPLRQGILVTVLLVLAAVAAWFLIPPGFFTVPGQSASSEPAAAEAKPAAVSAPATATVDAAAGAPSALTPPAATVLPSEGGEAPAAPVASAPDQRLLSFSFADMSWVEVRDAQQTIILTGKFPANTQQAVRGRPPFQVVIGNANAVKLRYEDHAIDLQPHIRAEVARFTLDDNSK